MGLKKKPVSNEALGIDLPTLYEPVVVETIPHEGYANNINTDYQVARQNMYQTIATGMKSLELLYQKQSESPTVGGMEVMATLMESVAKLNEQLIDLTDKVAGLDVEGFDEEGGNDYESQLFQGTTASILQQIREEKQRADVDTVSNEQQVSESEDSKEEAS